MQEQKKSNPDAITCKKRKKVVLDQHFMTWNNGREEVHKHNNFLRDYEKEELTFKLPSNPAENKPVPRFIIRQLLIHIIFYCETQLSNYNLFACCVFAG